MGIAWRKKLAVTVKWLAAGPLLLFVLIYNRHLRPFQEGTLAGIFWCGAFLVMPAAAAFLVYWPQKKPRQDVPAR
jgi:hypothetical protein